MTVTWETNDHHYAFVRAGSLGILLCVERVIGSRLYGAVAVEGPVDVPLSQFVERATFQAFLGAKFRTVRGAQLACERYARLAAREHARQFSGKIQVVEPTDDERVFLQTWSQTRDAPQA